MKVKASMDVDNRNIDVAVSLKKDEDEPDFFENIGKIFDNVKVNALPEGATDVVDTD